MEQQALADVIACRRCKIVCVKAGKRPDGLQRYRCTLCGKTYSDRKEQSNVFGTKQAVADEKARLALQLLVEGNSIRSTERITGIHRDTIMKLLIAAGERCQTLLDTRVRNVEAKDVQCDEIWTFVGKKRARVLSDEEDGVGDAWTFIAIDRTTKLVLAWLTNSGNAIPKLRWHLFVSWTWQSLPSGFRLRPMALRLTPTPSA